MDVYLVPTGPDRYELYCEVSGTLPADADEAPPRSLGGRAQAVFRRALAEGEYARRGGATGGRSVLSRVRRALLRRIAEAIAEQRLLWYLRRETSARLVHPDDLPSPAAEDRARASLRGDRDKHRRWFVIDGLLTIASAPVALLPGPNFLAYYFIFRTVGHFLSLRGAEQGLTRLAWAPAPSAPLTGIRSALPLERDTRARRVDEIAAALGLSELGRFVENMADQ